MNDPTAGSDPIAAGPRESEQRLARELAGARVLQAISSLLIPESTRQSIFPQILDAAIELMGSDAATVQLLDSDGGTLILLAHRNLPAESVAHWQRVTTGSGSTCSTALRTRQRVLVSDVETYEAVAGTKDLDEYRRSRIRAVQSTPLCSRSGAPLGMLSTHWHRVHTPSEDELRLFDVLARQAADLIERTQAEQAARQSDEHFRLIANAAPVVIWMADVDLRCIYVNPAWHAITGLPVERAYGLGWADGIHPADLGRTMDTLQQAIARREACQVEYRRLHADGDYRWIVANCALRHHADGSFAGYIGSATDITERRRAQEALATIDRRLMEAQEAESARIARELHDDLMQRLAVLNISLGSLQQSTTPGDWRQTVAEAREEVLALARDVQALSHRLHPARLDQQGIAAAAESLCRELARQHGVEIAFRTAGVPDRLARGNAICLYRVLQEALHNAIRHGGGAGVEVTVETSGRQVVLTVRDHGPGFDLATSQGRGLGLTSMRERLDAVRGRLVMRSATGQGTTVTAFVPAIEEGEEPIPESTAGAAEVAEAASATSVAADLGAVAARPRVLLADDDERIRRAIPRLLSLSCEVVGCVADVASLLEAVQRLRPDVLLLDLSIEGVNDGIDACRRVKALVPEVDVVAFTGADDPALRRRVAEAGAVGYVWKPRAPDDLLPTIHALPRHKG